MEELHTTTEYPLISIVVPVYNAELFLKESCDSIIAQTYSNLEILFIDDGSTDDSPEILERYAQNDGRIRIIRQENRGAGAARNLGLDMAKGEYLSFLDADDFFEPNMIRIAYEKSNLYNADICIFRYDRIDEKNNFIGNLGYTHNLLPDKPCFSAEEIKEDIFNSTNPMVWNKLFRSTFIRDHEIRFMEIYDVNDMYFTYKSLVNANRIVVVSDILLHYRIGHISLSADRKVGNWIGLYKALLSIRDDIIICKPELEKDVFNLAVKCILRFINRIQDIEVIYSSIDDIKNIWINTLLPNYNDEFSYYNHREYARMQALINDGVEGYLLSEKMHYKYRLDEYQIQHTKLVREYHDIHEVYNQMSFKYYEISSLKKHVKYYIKKSIKRLISGIK